MKVSIKETRKFFFNKTCGNCLEEFKKINFWEVILYDKDIVYSELICKSCGGNTPQEVINKIYTGELSFLKNYEEFKKYKTIKKYKRYLKKKYR